MTPSEKVQNCIRMLQRVIEMKSRKEVTERQHTISDDKEILLSLREQGKTHKQIAEITGYDFTAIKNFFYRQRITLATVGAVNESN